MNIEYMEKKHKIIIGLLALIAVFWSFIFIQFTVDDSYITFRYAKNLVEHGVWNWDLVNDKVEAYTNFLYAILAIIPEKIGMNTPLFFKFIGIGSILYLSIRMYKLIDDKIVYLMALAFLLLNPFIYIHAYSGLETPLFIVLLFELTVLISDNVNKGFKYEKIILVMLLLLPMTRPEGALFSFVGFFLLIYQQKTIKAKGLFVAIVTIAVGYFIWRYQYFGHIFPNTFYIKSAYGFDIKKIIRYFVGNIQYFSIAFLLLFLVKNNSFRVLLGTVIILNIFLYGKSYLQMNYAERFPFQTFFPLFLASFIIVRNRVNAVTISVLAAFLLGFIYSQKGTMLQLATYYPKAIQSHAKLGVALSKYKDENLSLMVGDAGMIPYFSEWHAYDFIGLANAYIGQNGFSLEYMRKVSPDLIIMYSRTADEKGLSLKTYHQEYIYQYITESKQYTLVGASRWQDNYYMLCFLKNNITKFEDIKQSIQEVDSVTKNFKVSIKDFISLKYLIFPSN